jgi:hypothetical protein
MSISLLSEYLLSRLPPWLALTQVQLLVVKNGQFTPLNGSIE